MTLAFVTGLAVLFVMVQIDATSSAALHFASLWQNATGHGRLTANAA